MQTRKFRAASAQSVAGVMVNGMESPEPYRRIAHYFRVNAGKPIHHKRFLAGLSVVVRAGITPLPPKSDVMFEEVAGVPCIYWNDHEHVRRQLQVGERGKKAVADADLLISKNPCYFEALTKRNERRRYAIFDDAARGDLACLLNKVQTHLSELEPLLRTLKMYRDDASNYAADYHSIIDYHGMVGVDHLVSCVTL